METDMGDKPLESGNKQLRKIRRAGFAGCALALLTVLQTLFPILGFTPATLVGFVLHAHSEATGISTASTIGVSSLYILLNLLNVLLVVGLTVGIFSKNAICGVLLFAYCVVGLLASIPTALSLFGIPIILFILLLVYIVQGMDGIFIYRSLQKKKRAEQP
jgi:hypothetical protein